MFRTYSEAIDYLYRNLPMFQRVGAAAYKKDLYNTIELCKRLGNPQHQFKSIHVAGTNGKGSTSHMLAAILQSAGYKTGLYTSPHLKQFTERIKINGAEVDQQFVVDFTNRIREGIDEIQPSFFEITVAMAYSYFAEQAVDVAVVEVGLGGRLDSTNIITPEVSVITNISYDHMDILGSTLPEIAAEKAGIIKPGVPVVISEHQPAVEYVFTETARKNSAPVLFAATAFHCMQQPHGVVSVKRMEEETFTLVPELKGQYQLKNIPGVLMSVEVLREKGWKISDAAVKRGIENTIQLTGLLGRWQVLQQHPLMVCDTAHNESGVREVVEQISKQTFRQLFMVWGMVKDKNRQTVLSLLPSGARYIFCQASIPRALDAKTLQEEAKVFGLSGTVVHSVQDAVELAKSEAQQDDMIFIGGSTFVVAEVEGINE